MEKNVKHKVCDKNDSEEWTSVTNPESKSGSTKPWMDWTLQDVCVAFRARWKRGTEHLDSILPTGNIFTFIRWILTLAIKLSQIFHYFYVHFVLPVGIPVFATVLLTWQKYIARGAPDPEAHFRTIVQAFEKLNNLNEVSLEKFCVHSEKALAFSSKFWNWYNPWLTAGVVVNATLLWVHVSRDSQQFKATHGGRSPTGREFWQHTSWKTRLGVALLVLLHVWQLAMLWRIDELTMNNHQNPYKVLQIAPTANRKTIKGAYRKLSLVYHPDR